MELYIAGGCGEHGRNCFYVRGEAMCFLVDCGLMADTAPGAYPRLSQPQIDSLDCVFLTHSHADHVGALPWLSAHGYRGPIVAARDTAMQFPCILPQAVFLESLCPPSGGSFRGLDIRWGRSGHCAGSVWYRFGENGKAILFSGDYTEDTLVYACDPIRGQSADLAVLDCAYGKDETSFSAACGTLVGETRRLLAQHRLLVFPVPKYGRGLELRRLFSQAGLAADYFGDGLFLQNLADMPEQAFWYRTAEAADCATALYAGQDAGIVFVSDPQLRTDAARQTAEAVLRSGGHAVMTGTVEAGSCSEQLIRQGRMTRLRYPVHLNWPQYGALAGKNCFRQLVPYHTGAFHPPARIEF